MREREKEMTVGVRNGSKSGRKHARKKAEKRNRHGKIVHKAVQGKSETENVK